MLAFVNVHNLSPRTAVETVHAFSRPFVPVPVPAIVEPAAVIPPEPPAAAQSPAKPAKPGKSSAKPAAAVVTSETTLQPAAVAVIDRRRFLADLKQAKKNAGRHFPVVLNVTADRVLLESTDCEFYLAQTVDHVSRSGSGALTVPTDKMIAILSKLTAQEITVSLMISGLSAAVLVAADGGEFELSAELATGTTDDAQRTATRFEFFRGPFPAQFATITTAGELRAAIERVSFATDTDSTRYALGGILFDATADRLTLAATDSRRLAVRNIATTTAGVFPPDSKERPAFVVPVSAVQSVSDGLKRVPDSAAVAVAAHYGRHAETDEPNTVLSIVFECSDGSGPRFNVRTKPKEGRFPRYLDCIPRSGNFTATADRKQLVTALKTVSAVCDDDSRGIEFRFSDDFQTREFRGESASAGKSRVPFPWEISGVIPAAEETAGVLSITFDPLYFLDFLNESSADRVSLRIVDGETAGVLFDENDETAGLCVIMPLAQQ